MGGGEEIEQIADSPTPTPSRFHCRRPPSLPPPLPLPPCQAIPEYHTSPGMSLLGPGDDTVVDPGVLRGSLCL